MLGTPELDAFISRSFTAIVTTVRKNGTPSSSMISYARLDNRLYFSTTVGRVKGHTLQNDPRIAVCVINETEPNTYATVEGTVVIHRDNPRALHERIYAYWETFAATYPKCPWVILGREKLETMWAQPGRAVFEVVPNRVSGYLL